MRHCSFNQTSQLFVVILTSAMVLVTPLEAQDTQQDARAADGAAIKEIVTPTSEGQEAREPATKVEQDAAPLDAPIVTDPPKPTDDPFPNPFNEPMDALRWLLLQTEQNSHNLSPIGMYRAADIVVKLVMLGLVLASFATWTIFIAKSLQLWGAKRRAQSIEKSGFIISG